MTENSTTYWRLWVSFDKFVLQFSSVWLQTSRIIILICILIFLNITTTRTTDVSFVIRKVASSTSPTIEISLKDDGTIVCKTVSTFKNSQIEFKLGEEFVEKRMDGIDAKTIITQEGNKLIQKQSVEPPVEIIREFTGDKLITTCKCKDVVCVREYKKQ